MLRLRLITGPVLILALLALLWGDGRMSASLQDNDLVRTAMGTADGVLLAVQPHALAHPTSEEV